MPNSKDDLKKMYGQLFEGLGEISGLCNIMLIDKAQPVVQCNRRIPLSLRPKLKSALNNLESKNVISNVKYPTPWVNSLMLVEKTDGSLLL